MLMYDSNQGFVILWAALCSSDSFAIQFERELSEASAAGSHLSGTKQ